MAGVIIPPGYIQVQYLFHSAVGHPCQNVMAYSVTGGITQTNVNTISSTMATPYKNWLNTAGSFDGVKVIVGNDGPESEYISTNGAGNGTRSVAVCPPQVQVVLAKATGLRGRKYRGRCFLPDVGEADIGDSGILGGTTLTLANALASAMNSAIGLGSLIGASYILHKDSTPPTLVTNFGADPKVGTLRSRFTR